MTNKMWLNIGIRKVLVAVSMSHHPFAFRRAPTLLHQNTPKNLEKEIKNIGGDGFARRFRRFG